ncbi:MAG: phytanoyl-CoA dioxygenase family protein [Planctomycetaceae bacterium]
MPSATLSESRLFTPQDVEQFHRDGFAIVRSLADERMRTEMLRATLDGIGREIEPIEYEADLQYPGAPMSLDAQGGRTPRRLKQAHSRGIVFTDWLMHPGLTGRLRQLLGEDLVVPLAHHNCIMTKQPRYSSDTGWHQDVRYWSFTRPELISIWLALGTEDERNGCLRLVPGSHRERLARDRFDEELFLRTDLLRSDLEENQSLLSRQVQAELEPGDVLFFHCLTLHAASRNHTADPKFSVVFTVRPLDNPPRPGTRSAAPELLVP